MWIMLRIMCCKYSLFSVFIWSVTTQRLHSEVKNQAVTQIKQYLCSGSHIAKARLKVREMEAQLPITICVSCNLCSTIFEQHGELPLIAFSTSDSLWSQPVQAWISVAKFKNFKISHHVLLFQNPLAGNELYERKPEKTKWGKGERKTDPEVTRGFKMIPCTSLDKTWACGCIAHAKLDYHTVTHTDTELFAGLWEDFSVSVGDSLTAPLFFFSFLFPLPLPGDSMKPLFWLNNVVIVTFLTWFYCPNSSSHL